MLKEQRSAKFIQRYEFSCCCDMFCQHEWLVFLWKQHTPYLFSRKGKLRSEHNIGPEVNIWSSYIRFYLRLLIGTWINGKDTHLYLHYKHHRKRVLSTTRMNSATSCPVSRYQLKSILCCKGLLSSSYGYGSLFPQIQVEEKVVGIVVVVLVKHVSRALTLWVDIWITLLIHIYK